MLMRVVLFLVMTFPSFSFSWMDKLFGAKFTWANLFGGLVLTQPFSLDCHHTLFFHLEQKWEGTKFLGYYETFLGYYKFIFHLFPYCFLENCKWGNGQLVEYNISTEEFKRECMYKLMLPIFFSILWCKPDQRWRVIPFYIHPTIPSKITMETDAPYPQHWYWKALYVIIYFNTPALNS